MARLYTEENFHMKETRGIPNTGLKILDQNGDTRFSLYKNIHDDGNTILLHTSPDSDSNVFDGISDDEFKSILLIARRYALEHDKSLVLSDTLVERYDVQNFVVFKDDMLVPLMNEEIVKMNESGSNIHIKLPELNGNDLENDMMFRKKSGNDFANRLYRLSIDMRKTLEDIYIVSSGQIHIDMNGQNSHRPQSNSIKFYKKKNTNDYSNIDSIEDSNNKNVHVSFSPSIDGDKILFPKTVKNVVVETGTERSELDFINKNSVMASKAITKITDHPDNVLFAVKHNKGLSEIMTKNLENIYELSERIVPTQQFYNRYDGDGNSLLSSSFLSAAKPYIHIYENAPEYFTPKDKERITGIKEAVNYLEPNHNDLSITP